MKRIFDLFLICLSLVVLIPIFIITAIMVLIFIGRPVIFTQIRPGKDRRPFKMYKFRTMTNEVDSAGILLPNEKRMTKFGSFLRHTSLDEIPEFFNVLKGEMSIVGPRPLLMDYLMLFDDFQNRRHEVLPGITGWAQINGRNAITWDERFKLDIWYVDNHNLLLDIKIIWVTVIKIFKREGINNKGEIAMPRFEGNKNH